jgi:methylphosphotriester-DNA--protein-cysteine methyltransferase
VIVIAPRDSAPKPWGRPTFHRQDCPFRISGRETGWEFYASAAKAMADNRLPCLVCKPVD